MHYLKQENKYCHIYPIYVLVLLDRLSNLNIVIHILTIKSANPTFLNKLMIFLSYALGA